MKNIENIPEMQLVKRGDSGIEKFEVGKDVFPFNGYFIAIIKSEGPISDYSREERREKFNNPEYIFSGNKITSHQILKRIFQNRHKEHLKEGDMFIPVNGGELEITENKIRLYGQSGTYGKYSQEGISPLVNRFVEENLSGHEVIYE